ncbi:MAG: hypothetical protein JNK20_19620 [Flavipsychrobacter sp.]|nr:hypothetical protein [Flavipsychrobacter sp.]
MRRILVLLITLIIPALHYAQKACVQDGSTLIANTSFSLIHSISSTSQAPILAVPALITIPVVVHILESGTVSVSDEQVSSQLEALNRDFQAANLDLASVPERFKHLVANCNIRFELAKVDPAGDPTSGILRVKAGVNQFSLDNRIKFRSKGGADAWPSAHYLNIWVGNMVSGIMGYSSMPGSAPELDGVVLNQTVFGTLNKKGRYTLGRVAVHEIGHWLGLKHIWGDAYCGDDGIADTPPQKSYNRGCPSGILQTCGNDPNGDMYMNYMDLTDDSCMYMFTLGQREKMRSVFAAGAPRNSILAGLALQTDGDPIDPEWGLPDPSSIRAQALQIFPVPASTEIRVEISDYETMKQKHLFIYTMMGQLILQVPVRASQVIIPIGKLMPGQYLIKTDRADQPVGRFVKM